LIVAADVLVAVDGTVSGFFFYGLRMVMIPFRRSFSPPNLHLQAIANALFMRPGSGVVAIGRQCSLGDLCFW